MLTSFRHISIKRKLTLVIMVASMATLLLASAALFVFYWVSAREAIQRDLQTQAQIIAANSTAALVFQDRQAATETVSALKAKAHILGASLYLPDGSRLAYYGKEEYSAAALPNPTPEGLQFGGPHLLLYHPVILDARRVGTLHLRYDFRAMEIEIVKPFLPVMAAIALASFLCAAAVSSSFQPLILSPILRLADAARSVAGHQDYSVRVEQTGSDEIGILTQAFNQMLARIQEQDASLRATGERYVKQQQTLTALARGELLYGEDLDATLRRVCEAVARTLGVGRAGLWRWNDTRALLQCKEYFAMNPQPSMRGAEASLADCPEYAERLNNSEILALDDAAADPQSGRRGWPPQKGVTSLLDAPIGLNGRTIGVLRLEHDGPARHWQPDEEMFATAMTNLLSMAFAHWERKQTQEALDKVTCQLIDTSHKAGMAEIATSVLHNVGNVLNSVNVSCTLVLDQVEQSRVADLTKLAAMLEAQADNLGDFIANDPKGRQIPRYLCMLAPVLTEERSMVLQELRTLRDKIDHIKEIVAMQQSYAGISGVTETLPATQLVEDALTLNTTALARHGIQVAKQFDASPQVTVNKHKVLQILINLIRNAKNACDEGDCNPKQVVLRVCRPAPQRVQIQIVDNGVGIPRENMTKIFTHGFTTFRNGHGFGLHSGALAAAELGGTLTAHSDGPGKGATFTLELPAQG